MHISTTTAQPTHHATSKATAQPDKDPVAPPPPRDLGARSAEAARTAPPPSLDPAKGQLLNTYV